SLPDIERGSALRLELRLHAAFEEGVVAMPAQRAERVDQRAFPFRVRDRDKALEFAQGGAQAPDAYAQLVDVLGIGTAGADLARVAQQLVQAASHHGHGNFSAAVAVPQTRLHGADRRAKLLTRREAMALGRLAGGAEPQRVGGCPLARQPYGGDGFAL